MSKSYRGTEKSGVMQEKILDRVDRTKFSWQETTNEPAVNKPAWTPERWARKVTVTVVAKPEVKDLDLTALKDKFK